MRIPRHRDESRRSRPQGLLRPGWRRGAGPLTSMLAPGINQTV